MEILSMGPSNSFGVKAHRTTIGTYSRRIGWTVFFAGFLVLFIWVGLLVYFSVASSSSPITGDFHATMFFATTLPIVIAFSIGGFFYAFRHIKRHGKPIVITKYYTRRDQIGVFDKSLSKFLYAAGAFLIVVGVLAIVVFLSDLDLSGWAETLATALYIGGLFSWLFGPFLIWRGYEHSILDGKPIFRFEIGGSDTRIITSSESSEHEEGGKEWETSVRAREFHKRVYSGSSPYRRRRFR